MIIRKPYAFLIKHFRRIHIFMLVLCAFIYYKNMQTRSFVKEFLELQSYDAFYEPITKYASILALLVLIILVALSITIIVLLRHKKKPWKLYIVPAATYAFIFIAFVLTITLFSGYDEGSGTTGIRAISDLLFMGTIPQYFVIIILLMRIFGVDLNKFDFKSDQEYLELSNDDREEIEISVNIDKESFKRIFKRLLRNLGYFYEEHKLLCNTVASILIVVFVVSVYKFVFITHKSYGQDDVIPTDGYSIQIHHVYYTDKDYRGEIISKDSAFVILDLTLTNNQSQREVNFNRFHMMNGRNNYSQTYRTYETSFQDFGQTTYEKLTLDNGQSARFLLIFKVANDLNPDRFVLYYQEINNNIPYLRKIKLDVENLSEIKTQKTKSLRDYETLNVGGEDVSFSIESYGILQETTYNVMLCPKNDKCYSAQQPVTAANKKMILELFFTSDTFSGKEFVDFSEEYGKIVYIDNKGKRHTVAIKDAVDKQYFGNYMYFLVPQRLQDAKEIRLVYTVRNREYVYRLK